MRYIIFEPDVATLIMLNTYLADMPDDDDEMVFLRDKLEVMLGNLEEQQLKRKEVRYDAI